MGIRTLASLALSLFTLATGFQEGVWGPEDHLSAIVAVEQALGRVVNASGHSPERLQMAKKVASEIMQDLHEVEQSKTMSKEQRQQKMSHALKTLMGLKDEFEKPRNATATRERLEQLKKQLDLKKTELAKEENMLKLAIMQKDLLEKKMKLQQLIDQKKATEAQADEKQQREMLAKLVDMAKSASAPKASKVHVVSHNGDQKDKTTLPKELQSILIELEGRAGIVTKSIEKLNDAEKKQESELVGSVDKMPVDKQDGAAVKKEASMLRMIKKEVHRKFEKVRAAKRTELASLKEAMKEIKVGDVESLKKTLAKMQQQATVKANGNKFLV